MNICAKCGFENDDKAKNCVNCLTDLHWAKVNLGKFHGNKEDTRRIGIESRKERGYSVPEDEFTPLEPIQIVKNEADKFAFGQFVLGFIGWAVVSSLFNMNITLKLDGYIFFTGLIVNQLIGLGIVFYTFQHHVRWIGIGILCSFGLFLFGSILRSPCIPPLLLPFPLTAFGWC